MRILIYQCRRIFRVYLTAANRQAKLVVRVVPESIKALGWYRQKHNILPETSETRRAFGSIALLLAFSLVCNDVLGIGAAIEIFRTSDTITYRD